MKTLMITALLMGPMMAQAGEATLTGYGELVAKPEFVNVTVRVSSECFNSALQVSKANDEVATKVLETLNALADTTKGDQVTASGGYVQRYTGYSPITGQQICVNHFRKINTLSFKTSALENFANTFALLQEEIYKLGMDTAPASSETPTNYLEISEPVAGISVELHKTLERQALAIALQDAKEKFQATLALANVDKYKIVNFSENAIPPRYVADESRKSIGAPNTPAPVELGTLTITKFLNVRFEYTGGEMNLVF
jgi:uncharacterized protein YggE